MPLLGSAAMLLSFDVAPELRSEHDDWHTHEHLPERLAIPGFLRGSRWVAQQGQPAYFVMYEVERLEILSSAAYLERLNHPSPWTTRMMPHYRGMARGFCLLSGSFGLGLGHAALVLRLRPRAGAEAGLRRWLLEQALPPLPARPGLGSAHLFEGAATPVMTNEQRIRGADAGVDWVLLVTGYRSQALAALVETELGAAQLQSRGAEETSVALYRLDDTLTDREARAGLRF